MFFFFFLIMKPTPCTATNSKLAKTKRKPKTKQCNKRGGWRRGLPQLVSTFLADNKGCLCLDELLRALSFHNPRPHTLCFSDPMCQWIKMWDVQMDWAFQRHFIKCKQTPLAIQKEKNPTPDSSSSWPCSLMSSQCNTTEGQAGRKKTKQKK